MAESPGNPTDTAICRLLAGGPLPTAVIAGRLGAPERTVRHRLHRLREAGAVVTGSDGLHRLAAGPLPAPAAGPLPAVAATGVAPDRPASDGPSPGRGEPWGAGIVLAAAALGLAVALVIRRMSPPPPPAPATGFGDADDLWGGLPW